jgi:zinc protease
VLADIRRIMADIVRNGAPPELVAAAKRRELAQLGFQADNISGLAEAWSQALALQGLSSPDDLARAYSAVTVDDVNRLARQILDPVHAVTAILTPQGSGKPERGKGFGSDESFDVIPDHPVTLPEWATEELSSLALPDPVEPPDVSVLPNGLRLIVQPEHVSHTVSVYGRVHQVAATQEPPGKEGVAMVTGRLFKYGTHLHDRVAFQEALDDIAAQLGAGPFFYLKVLTPQFERGMQLLAENELHPAFPADAFPVVRQQMVRALDGMLRTPDYLFRHAASAAIVPADDAALRQPTPDTVSALQPDDVLAFYASAYRPDLTTLVVVGDVTAADVRRIVIGTFGAWLPNGPTPAIDLPPVQPSGSSQMRIPDRSSLQADVALTEALTLPAASPDRYTLILGNVILGDGFSSRLYRDLRVRTGYVYSVGSEVNWTRTRADFTITFGSDPAKVNPARLLAVRDLKAMQAAPVSDADLTRAKAQVLRQLQMQRASVPEIAGLFLERTGLGLPLEAPDATARRYLAITAPQIQQAFTTWLRPDDLAQVVKGPAAP